MFTLNDQVIDMYMEEIEIGKVSEVMDDESQIRVEYPKAGNFRYRQDGILNNSFLRPSLINLTKLIHAEFEENRFSYKVNGVRTIINTRGPEICIYIMGKHGNFNIGEDGNLRLSEFSLKQYDGEINQKTMQPIIKFDSRVSQECGIFQTLMDALWKIGIRPSYSMMRGWNWSLDKTATGQDE